MKANIKTLLWSLVFCRPKLVIAVFLAISSLFLPPLATFGTAQEIINNFQSKISIAENGDLTVVETIAVLANGRHIKRGIFRDLENYADDANDKPKRVKYDIISVKRNGRSEPFHTSQVNSFTRIYIGQQDIFIPYGPHIYEITYKTNRHIRFFDTYEELYWNVTGNEWSFPIKKAGAEVTIAGEGTFSEANFFTGQYGQTQKKGLVIIEDQGRKLRFQTNPELGLGGGLTLKVKMAPGTVNPPSSGQLWTWYMRDFGHVVIAMATLIIAGLYYLVAWFRFGRDPQGADIKEREYLSLGISPALAHYIDNNSKINSAWTAISAAILSLAVKGYLRIEKPKSKPVLVAEEGQDNSKLPTGEAIIMKAVNRTGSFKLSKTNGSRISTMKSEFIRAIEGENRKVFYEHNTSLVVIGIALSVLGILSTIFFNYDGLGLTLLAFMFFVVAAIISFPLYYFVRMIIRSTSFVLAAILIAGFGVLVFLTSYVMAQNGSQILGFNSQLLFSLRGLFLLAGIFFAVIIATDVLFPQFFGELFTSRLPSVLSRNLLIPIFTIIIIFGGNISQLFRVEFLDALTNNQDLPFMACIFGLLFINIVFFTILGRPTVMGAQMQSQIEGLRIHLQNYHEQRMNMLDIPDMTPKYFEKQLPYAVALEVEKPWSEAFDEWLTSAEAISKGVKDYEPEWDNDRWFSRGSGQSRNGGFSDFGKTMSSSFSDAMPTPKSSSSGGGFSSSSSGGGFSGGGSGGGGGGGW